MKGKFLVVTYVAKPIDPNKTSRKDSKKNNMTYDERVSLNVKVTEKELIKSSIVLDLENKKVLRTKHGFVNDYDKLFALYYENYKKYIDEFLNPNKETDIINTEVSPEEK